MRERTPPPKGTPNGPGVATLASSVCFSPEYPHPGSEVQLLWPGYHGVAAGCQASRTAAVSS
jgi:hypothetical protein